MASLHKQAGNRPGYKLRFRDSNKRQRVLWLGDVSKRSANEIMRHVSELAESNGRNVKPDVASVEWGNNLTGRLRQRLAEWGYVAPERETTRTATCYQCKQFFESWIKSRTDLKWRTRNNYEQAVTAFIRFAGDDRLLNDVTPADIDSLRLWMLSKGKSADEANPIGYASATVNKHLKRLRTLFSQAVKARLLKENPVSQTRIGGELNRERDHYVDGAVADKFLAWCEKNGEYDWALVFAFARFAGLRPCEILTITWRDVDWAENRMRVDSPKTGLRFCPIFAPLRRQLNIADELARPGAIKVVSRHTEANLRTMLNRKLEQAGIKPWPKTFMNLRASCRTDLEEQRPSHIASAWLGHSKRVAERHYLQVTEGHWEGAASVTFGGGNAGGNISANPLESSTISNEKIPGKTTAEGSRFPGIRVSVPPQGLEPWTR